VRQRSGRITPILLWVRGSRTNPQQIGEKHGPDQDIAAPRHVVEFLEIALGLRGVEEIPLGQPGVKESLDRSLVESRIGDSKPKLGAEAAECAR